MPTTSAKPKPGIKPKSKTKPILKKTSKAVAVKKAASPAKTAIPAQPAKMGMVIPFNAISKKQVIITDSQADIIITGLRPKETYVVELELSSKSAQSLTLKFVRQYADIASFEIKIGPAKKKRYLISPDRQEGDGTARIRLTKDGTAPYAIISSPLEITGESDYALQQRGLCPIVEGKSKQRCKREGEWRAMALCCPVHGPFLGG